ncbi:MAG: RES family NAD+ phosphorylase [Elusimicrobiota bacterium]|nr:RES family NAD+ phosphorylase [Elusimicrobiota bacterium]
MPARPNLAAIAGLGSISFSDSVYRVVPGALRDKILSTEGNRYYPGRYHAAGETGILYTSLERDLAIRELGRHAARADLQGGLAAGKIKVKLQKVLDLTQAVVLAKLGLSKEALISPDCSLTQAVSHQARKAGFQGLLVPSAAGSGVNLVVFVNNLAEGCLIEVDAVGPVGE